MTVNDILEGTDVISVKGDRGRIIKDIQFDSRKVSKDSMFVAVRGTNSDGHDFIGKAVENGAAAVICEILPPSPDEKIAWILTRNSAKALGTVSSAFYGNPSSKLKLVGVTGTNGKTTIATLLYRMFSKLGYKSGLLSTVCNYVVDRELPSRLTTPDPVEINFLLSQMVETGCDYAFMEVSSHSADQQRIAGLSFRGGIFTNLTHDHLDYHRTFDNYLDAKKKFFDALEPEAFALVNSDDKNGKVMVQNCRARKFFYSLKGMADFRCTIIEQSFGGMGLRIDGEEVWTRFAGEFNASNLLAVYGASILLGAGKEEILTILSDLRPVPGRLEIISGGNNISCIVDYAHTPDALRNVIETINKIRGGEKQLITVVGAGGDRDPLKRPRMALICAEGSSKVILTSDNPRTEDPEKIIDDMEAGIPADLKNRVIRISNRREAIKTAVTIAGPGDIVLVAGKGHETYQDIKGVKYHFDDREEVKKALNIK